MEQKDLMKVNEIDMECNVDDEDDGFGGFVTTEPKKELKSQRSQIDFSSDSNIQNGLTPVGSANDGREISSKTGIILDFGETEYDINPLDVEIVSKPITAQLFDDGVHVDQPIHPETDFSGYNQVDMECSIGEDDDFGQPSKPVKHSGDFLDFSDEDDEIEKELVNEEIVEESKKKAADQLDQGKVEADYYEKLKKKHLASNKKGAYNIHFHFAGNPKVEMDDFNHDNTPQGPIPNAITAPSVGAGDSNMTVAAQGMGMAEGYKKLFEELLLITGFELNDCGEGKCSFKDKYSNAPEKVCTTINDVEEFLAPYITDCFIIPLQVETGEKFKTCKDWASWYTPEVESKFPQCKQDINYCDLCANHLADCKLF